MSERYDLFRLTKDTAIWIGTAETMQDANVRASEITGCDECLVLDSETGEKTVLKTGGHEELAQK
jgi:hypothetical protein